MGNISAWNARVDHTVQRIGRNGVWYEYLMPRDSNDMFYYKEALDVRSKKSPNTDYYNGKKPGQYQPVGDKRYFNYYQLKKMKNNGSIKKIEEKLLKEYDDYIIQKTKDKIMETINNG